MWEAIRSLVETLSSTVRPADLLDIAVISGALYVALVWMSTRVSRAVGIGIGLVVAMYGVSRVLSMYLTQRVFEAGFTIIVVILVLVFQDDIRRVFEQLRSVDVFGRRKNGEAPSDEMADTLVESAKRLADRGFGALIVLVGRESIDVHTHGGIEVGAETSLALFLSIFDPGTPGHDGAVVIDEGRVDKMGVHLPLSTAEQKLGPGGTRHAAALGVAERTDALCLVVSEERQTISVAREGRLEAVEDGAALKGAIEDFRETDSERMSWWCRWGTRRLGMKLVSVVLAAGLWAAMAWDVETVQRTFEVPIAYRNVPEGLSIGGDRPQTATLELEGASNRFEQMDRDGLSVTADLGDAEPGTEEVTLTAAHLDEPNRMSVVRIEPRVVLVHLFAMLEVTLPVEVMFQGQPPDGLRLQQAEVRPDEVSARIRRRNKTRIRVVRTTPVDLGEFTEPARIERKLIPPEHGQLGEDAPEVVEITVQVVPESADDTDETDRTDDGAEQ